MQSLTLETTENQINHKLNIDVGLEHYAASARFCAHALNKNIPLNNLIKRRIAKQYTLDSIQEMTMQLLIRCSIVFNYK